MRAPPDLSALQAFLQTALRREEPIEGAPEVEAGARRFVAGNARLSPAAQADIYREQYWLRHRGSLGEDYLGLSSLLGEAAFESFLNAYLTACPPRHPSLRDLGDRIVDFARRYEGFDPELRPAALDMIRYENAMIDVFDGAEPPPLDASKLASMDEDAWDRARLVLHPLLVRMKLDYPVHTYRIAAKALFDARDEAHGEHACCDAPHAAPPAKLDRAPVCLGLFRADLVVSYEELDPLAFALLDAIAAGASLTRACEQVAEPLTEEEAGSLMGQVGAWFQQWTAWRWIVDIIV